MIDAQYLLGLGKHPTIKDLILAYACYEALKGEAHVSDVIRSLGLNKDTAYRRLRELEEELLGSAGSLIEKKPGKGTTKVIGDKELFLDIGEVLRAYQKLRQTVRAARRVRIRLGATNICLLRLVPELHRKFRGPWDQRQGEQDGERDERRAGRNGGQDEDVDPATVDWDLVQGEWYELARGLQEGALDVAVTACREGFPGEDFPGVHVIQDVRLPRCLIYPIDHPFNTECNEQGFDWEKEFKAKETRKQAWRRLGGETLVVLADQRADPDFPWKKVPRLDDPQQRVVKLGSYAEIHAHVLAGGGVAFSHQELLGEEEEQHLTVVDVSAELGKTRICALRSTRSEHLGMERKVIDRLCTVMREYLEDMEKRIAGGASYAYLRKYCSLWHATTGDGDVPKWVRGTVRLQVTPAGYIKGIERSEIRKQPFRIFGRILDGHIVWHGISHDAESFMRWRPGKRASGLRDHYAIDFHLPATADKPLVGTWMGKDYGHRSRSGMAVLHHKEITSWERLNAIVEDSGIKHLQKARGIATTMEDL